MWQVPRRRCLQPGRRQVLHAAGRCRPALGWIHLRRSAPTSTDSVRLPGARRTPPAANGAMPCSAPSGSPGECDWYFTLHLGLSFPQRHMATISPSILGCSFGLHLTLLFAFFASYSHFFCFSPWLLLYVMPYFLSHLRLCRSCRINLPWMKPCSCWILWNKIQRLPRKRVATIVSFYLTCVHEQCKAYVYASFSSHHILSQLTGLVLTNWQ